jgi:hypothetical protein
LSATDTPVSIITARDLKHWSRVRDVFSILSVLILLLPSTAAAQPTASTAASTDDGAPRAPREIVSRDADGKVTIRAVRLTEPLRIDGRLEEPLYFDVDPVSQFIQVEPEAGRAASEKTDVWVAFDADRVYVSFRAWDSQMDRLVATEMRRDNGAIWSGNDIVVFVFDTFNDRRSSLSFTINALGGRSDGQVINERQFNPDWNPVWNVKTGRFDGGWTVEAELPFKSLRYGPGASQVWGFNAMRVKRSKNEISTMSRVPPSQGQQGVEQPVFAATLVGIEAPRGGRNLDVKPYATSNLTTDRLSTPERVNDGAADFGVDMKYGVTQNLTADFTYNTDFAQVEADQQQVNLTRFSLFFPEKREFFLENAGTFSFGGVPVGSLNSGTSDAPVLFYSRQIGLNDGHQVPIRGGGRLTGRAGRYSVGMINIQTDTDPVTGAPAANFAVARLKRDLFRRSSVGMIITNHSAAAEGRDPNLAYGVDGTFAFFQNLQLNTYWARTRGDLRAASVEGHDTSSYRGQLLYTGDRYGVEAERLVIGNQFDPHVGFVRRADMARDFGLFRFSPRPNRRQRIRKFVYQGSFENIRNVAGRLDTRRYLADTALEFQNADRVSLNYTNSFERLPAPFRIARGVTLPVGEYHFDTWRANYNMGQQRPMSANLTLEAGRFYDGHKTTVTMARGRVPLMRQLSAEPTYSYNRVSLVEGRFTTHLAGSRLTYSMTPLMFASALIQFNSGTRTISTNARLRWEYQPGSELFVVYNDERNTALSGFPTLNNRAVIVKVNRLFRF